MSHISRGPTTAASIAAHLGGLPYTAKLDAAAGLLGRADFEPSLVDAVFDAVATPATTEDREALAGWAAGLPPTPSVHYLRARLASRSDPGASAAHWTALFASAAVSDPFLHLQGARTQLGVGHHAEAARLLRHALLLRPAYGFYARSEKLLLEAWRQSPPSARRCRIAVLGSSTTALMLPVLRALCFRDGIDAEFYEGTYGAFRQEVLDPASGLHRFRPDVVFVVTHWRDVDLPAIADDPDAAVAAVVAEFTSLWQAMGHGLGCHVVQHAFDEPASEAYGYLSQTAPGGRLRLLRRINERLASDAPSHVSILDTPAVMAAVGASRWEDPFLWHTAKQHPGLEALPELAELQVAHVRAVLGLTRKVLVCDLDNTLWGGVIGDDGIDGIQLGPASAEGEAFSALQRYLRDLKEPRHPAGGVLEEQPGGRAAAVRGAPATWCLRLDDFVAFTRQLGGQGRQPARHRRAADRSGSTASCSSTTTRSSARGCAAQLPEVAVLELGAVAAHLRARPGPRALFRRPDAVGRGPQPARRLPGPGRRRLAARSRRPASVPSSSSCRCAPPPCRWAPGTSRGSRS